MLTKEQTTNLLSMLEIIKDRSDDKITKVLVASCVEIINADIRINKIAWRLGNKVQDREEQREIWYKTTMQQNRKRWRPRKTTYEQPLLNRLTWQTY